MPTPFADLAQAAVDPAAAVRPDHPRRVTGADGDRARRIAAGCSTSTAPCTSGSALIPGADEADRRPARRRPPRGLPVQQAAARRGATTRTSSRAWAFPRRPSEVVNSSLVLARHLHELDPGRAGLRDRRAAAASAEMRAHGFEVRNDAARAVGGHRLRPHVRLRQAQHRAAGGATARRPAHRHQSRPHLPGRGRRDPRLRGHDRGGGGRDRQEGRGRRGQAIAHHLRGGAGGARRHRRGGCGHRRRPHRDRHRDGQALGLRPSSCSAVSRARAIRASPSTAPTT